MGTLAASHSAPTRSPSQSDGGKLAKYRMPPTSDR